MGTISVSIHYMDKFIHYKSLLEKSTVPYRNLFGGSKVILSYIHDISSIIREKVHYMGMIGAISPPPPVYYMGKSIIWENPLYG